MPRTFAQFKLTLHIPRRPYVEALPGIPTIRPIEALACGMPLVCSLWNDVEHLFQTGSDFLIASDGEQMKRHLAALLRNPERRYSLGQSGLATIRARHTCAHRVDELLEIVRQVLREREPAPSRRRP